MANDDTCMALSFQYIKLDKGFSSLFKDKIKSGHAVCGSGTVCFLCCCVYFLFHIYLLILMTGFGCYGNRQLLSQSSV